jgi:ATP-dependent exoDNAse (exonuclease V) alpha subunit
LRQPLSVSEANRIIKKLNKQVVSNDNLPENTTLNDIHICGTNKQVNLVNQDYKMVAKSKIICNMKCYDTNKVMIANGQLGVILANELGNFSVQWEDGIISKFRQVGGSVKKPRFSPAYGLTVHKAQGRTIKRNLIINPTKLFARNHLYVALTRATSLNNVYLTDKITMYTLRKTVQILTSDDEIEMNFDEPMSIYDL